MLYKYCLRCGKRLKSDEARQRGYGITCYEKSRHTPIRKPLIDSKNK